MRNVAWWACALLAAAGCESVEAWRATRAAAPAVRVFGATRAGEKVSLYTLRGVGGLTLEVTDFGGRLVRCWAPDRDGRVEDVTLGWNTVAEYEQNGFSMGTLIGRYGNRIRDGRFALDGKTYQLPVNEVKPAPRHCNLHGGPQGWDTKVWRARPFVEKDGVGRFVPGLELLLDSPDGDMGFPGRVACTVTYRVFPDNVWRIDYRATTDRPTVLNLTHHSYWNLAGEASGDVLGQELQLFADLFTKTDDGLIPVANAPVKGTGFDFTELRRIGARADWMAACDWLKCTDNWYDHNFFLRGEAGTLRPAAVMRDPASGRKLEVFTTEPCLQVYGAQNMDGTLAAKTPGRKYVKYAGLALETQHAPDSPNRPDFPSVALRPGETFRSTTLYRFSAE